MLLRDTELIGKKLVKYGFSRSHTDHQNYTGSFYNGAITVHFVRLGSLWAANFVHYIDTHTTVKFTGYEGIFTPEWLRKEHKKLQALFKFARL
jgi:hypothetical protein